MYAYIYMNTRIKTFDAVIIFVGIVYLVHTALIVVLTCRYKRRNMYVLHGFFRR